MKGVARSLEHQPVLRIPVVVGMSVVAVQPATVRIVLQLEHVRVAIGIDGVRMPVRNTAR